MLLISLFIQSFKRGGGSLVVRLRVNIYVFIYYNISLHFIAPPTFAASTVKTPERREPTTTPLSTLDRGRHSNLVAILGIVTGILIISIICVLILCLFTLRPKTKTPHIEIEKPRIEHAISFVVGSISHPTSTRFISYEDLREATNNFEPASILGEGDFGRVFKGVLNDGTAVAIKRLTSGRAAG
ncbi:proline-rich receptor protein kinase PERK3 [Trifolium repens]|nr:proline-rich receptor protein kinase PERK3 [Trifolium repens]